MPDAQLPVELSGTGLQRAKTRGQAKEGREVMSRITKAESDAYQSGLEDGRKQGAKELSDTIVEWVKNDEDRRNIYEVMADHKSRGKYPKLSVEVQEGYEPTAEPRCTCEVKEHHISVSHLEEQLLDVLYMVKLLKGSAHALRSYENGNSDPTMARMMADQIDAALQSPPAIGEGEKK
jgi:hypothetical protein